MQKDFVDLGGRGEHILRKLFLFPIYLIGGIIFFQKGTPSAKKTNFGIIQEPDQLLFRRDFFSFPLYFLFLNFYRHISIQKRRSPLLCTKQPNLNV